MWYIHEELGNCQYISVCIVPWYHTEVFFSSKNIFKSKKEKKKSTQFVVIGYFHNDYRTSQARL